MTNQEIIEAAKSIANPRTAGKIKLCLDAFEDVDSFIKATDGDLMRVYNEKRPCGVHGLGNMFFRAMDVIRGMAKVKCHEATKQETVKDVPPHRTETEVKQVFYTASFIKAVGAIMELGNIKEMDSEAINFLHEHFRMDEESETKKAASKEFAA